MKTRIHQCFGFVDLQVNGAVGLGFDNPDDLTTANLETFCRYQWGTGVVGCLATIVSNSDEVIRAVLARIREAKAKSRWVAATILGVHLEIYVSPKAKGCHNEDHLRVPDWRFIQSLGRNLRLVKLITLAPELPGSLEFIRKAVALGIVISLGHTMANHEEITRATKAGATGSTHFGNGIPAQLPRTNNQLIWQLDQPNLSAMFIADLHHLAEPALRVLIGARGVKQSIVVTDSISAAGLRDGEYSLAGKPIVVRNGCARPVGSEDILAGSVTNMLQSFDNLLKCGFETFEAIDILCNNPRQLLRMDHDSKAFVILMQDDAGSTKIRQTIVDGEVVVNS